MSTLRVSGAVSGMDTDQMVKDLMKAENMRVDKVKKERQLSVWQQEAYREVIDKIRALQSSYLDVLNPKQNISSSSSFGKFTYSVKSNGDDSTKVSVTASAGIVKNKHTISEITKLATKDSWVGEKSDLRGIKIEGKSVEDLKTSLDGKDLEFVFAIGKDTKVIKVDNATLAGMTDMSELATELNDKIEDAFGSDYSGIVSEDSGNLTFDLAGSELKILRYGENSETMTAIGYENGVSNYSFKTKSLGELFGLSSDQLTLSINDKKIVLSADDNINQAIDKINGSAAGVTLSYDSLKDIFELTSNSEGTSNNIKIEEGSDTEAFFSKLFNVSDLIDSGTGNVVNISRTEASNAQLVLDGVSIVQGNNSFTYEGVNYTLNETSTDPIDINVEVNTSDIVDNIKNFVKEYNDLIEFVTGRLTEKKNYDYAPLTDEEKESLSDDDVKKWEEKAKLGILKDASELETMLTKLRTSILDPVTNVGLSMKEIGIASTSYKDRGRLVVDETKLSEAIENNYDEVVNLFSKESDYDYEDRDNRSTRYAENGIGNRFDDLIKDYTRTLRDNDGNKGILLMKAGIQKDASEYSNFISKKITSYDDRIAEMLSDLADKEDQYYLRFSKMEAALSKLQSQSSSLMSQLGISS